MEILGEVDWDDAVLLSLILAVDPVAWSEDGLAEELGWPHERTDDALATLAVHGLVHRGEVVSATARGRRWTHMVVPLRTRLRT